MARRKEFNREEVLEKAMETFWCKGYEATSIEDLVKQMGINRGSLYDTFGDKRTLFLEAIAHYDNTVTSKAIAKLQAPGSAKQAIANYFQELVDRSIADRQRRGCLLTNSVVELGPHDPDAASHLAANLQRLETAFYKALVKARDEGEISYHKDIRALARFFTSSLQGLRVMSKVNPDPLTLRDISHAIVSVLD
jgi:TetR/AcrR family transcriptional regulator, transcriptional repressor for nem operon